MKRLAVRSATAPLILSPLWMMYALLFCPQQLVGHAGFEERLWHGTKQRLWDTHQ